MNRTYERAMTLEKCPEIVRRAQGFARVLAWLRTRRKPKHAEYFNIYEQREAIARRERHIAAAEISCRPWR